MEETTVVGLARQENAVEESYNQMWYWLPWSWRNARPERRLRRTRQSRLGHPWRIGSSASKQVARRAAWMPTHSVEQWSTVTKIAA